MYAASVIAKYGDDRNVQLLPVLLKCHRLSTLDYVSLLTWCFVQWALSVDVTESNVHNMRM